MPVRVPVRMPTLLFGADQRTISANIEQLRLAGIKGKQAQAIAYKQARRSGHRRKE